MPKYNKVTQILYIEHEGTKAVIENLIDPAPSIFETTKTTEVRFSINMTEENFNKYHAFDHLEDRQITVGVIYPDTNIEIKSSFMVESYERRFGTSKGAHITHVLQGKKVKL